MIGTRLLKVKIILLRLISPLFLNLRNQRLTTWLKQKLSTLVASLRHLNLLLNMRLILIRWTKQLLSSLLQKLLWILKMILLAQVIHLVRSSVVALWGLQAWLRQHYLRLQVEVLIVLHILIHLILHLVWVETLLLLIKVHHLMVLSLIKLLLLHKKLLLLALQRLHLRCLGHRVWPHWILHQMLLLLEKQGLPVVRC